MTFKITLLDWHQVLLLTLTLVIDMDFWYQRLALAESVASEQVYDVLSLVQEVVAIVVESVEVIGPICASLQTLEPGQEPVTSQTGRTVAVFEGRVWMIVKQTCRKLTKLCADTKGADEWYPLLEKLGHAYVTRLESASLAWLICSRQVNLHTHWLAERLVEVSDQAMNISSMTSVTILHKAGVKCTSGGLLRDASVFLSVSLKHHEACCERCGTPGSESLKVSYAIATDAALSLEYQSNFSAALQCRLWAYRLVSNEKDWEKEAAFLAHCIGVLAALAGSLQAKNLIALARSSMGIIAKNRDCRVVIETILRDLENNVPLLAEISRTLESVAEVESTDCKNLSRDRFPMNANPQEVANVLQTLTKHYTQLRGDDRDLAVWGLSVTKLHLVAVGLSCVTINRLFSGNLQSPQMGQSLTTTLVVLESLEGVGSLSPQAVAARKIKPLLALSKFYFHTGKLQQAKELAENVIAIRKMICPAGQSLPVYRASLEILLNVALQGENSADIESYCRQIDQMSLTPKNV